MTPTPPWADVKPRFDRMVLTVGFRVVARRAHIGKSSIYRWFKGEARRPGGTPIIPCAESIRAIVRALDRLDAEAARAATAWRGTNRTPAPWAPEVVRYR